MNKNVEVLVVPGVSSVQACAARLCIGWDDAALFAFHSGTDDKKKQDLAQVVKAGKTVVLLPEPKGFPPCEIATFLLSKGVSKKISVYICENLTLADERILETTLEAVAEQSFSSLCVMVIKGNAGKGV
jgi:cobalt-precorrin-7 (C5)-methyltransferase